MHHLTPLHATPHAQGIEVLGSEALKKFYLDPESGEGEGGSHSLDLSPELIMQVSVSSINGLRIND